VVPGIFGSRLVRDGQEIWGLPGGIVHNLIHPDMTLALDGDGYDVDPSVNADGLVRAPIHFPGLAKVDGLRWLVSSLRQRLESSHLLVFAYDWRLSNRVNGRLLAERVEQWRRCSRNRDAKLVLVCHSMGGLVARAFLDLEGGAEQCRRLVTVGTPTSGRSRPSGAWSTACIPGLGGSVRA
jgi:pimeloyl-ACP methyl ester carboxylesterase